MAKRHEAGFLNHEPDSREQQEAILERCEAALYDGLLRQLEAAVVVGTQFAQIRDKELYLAAGCRRFEAYCHRYLQMSLDQVRHYLALHEVIERLRVDGLQLPATATQALMLSKIPRSRLIPCWRAVLERCLREEVGLSDAIVRRAMRSERAREKVIAEGEKSRSGVQVILE
jgi:hypothetical protein